MPVMYRPPQIDVLYPKTTFVPEMEHPSGLGDPGGTDAAATGTVDKSSRSLIEDDGRRTVVVSFGNSIEELTERLDGEGIRLSSPRVIFVGPSPPKDAGDAGGGVKTLKGPCYISELYVELSSHLDNGGPAGVRIVVDNLAGILEFSEHRVIEKFVRALVRQARESGNSQVVFLMDKDGDKALKGQLAEWLKE